MPVFPDGFPNGLADGAAVLFPKGDGAAAVLPKGVVDAVAGVEVFPPNEDWVGGAAMPDPLPNGDGAAPDEEFPNGLSAGAEVPDAVVPNGLGAGAVVPDTVVPNGLGDGALPGPPPPKPLLPLPPPPNGLLFCRDVMEGT